MLMLDEHVKQPGEAGPGALEALIREARARTRRRRASVAVVIAAICAGTVSLLSLGSSSAKPPVASGSSAAPGVVPLGAVVSLRAAGPLAVAPDGALYVADLATHRVLVRLGDGRFRVVAGDGHDGYAGDGGAATRAELSVITDIAVAPDGDLYIADGGRIRVIGASGIIRTVAGDGEPLPMAHRRFVAAIVTGTPALKAALGAPRAASYAAPMINFSPGGQLYISTGTQVVRLTPRGTLTPVHAVVNSGPTVLHGALSGYGPLAIDARGNVDVSGFNGWSVWQIPASGSAREIGPGSGARRSGGGMSTLERAPNGHVYAENGAQLLEVDGNELKPAFNFGDSFFLTYFAFGPDGGIYADEISGDSGFEARQQLREVRKGRSVLLWEQPRR